MDLVSKIEALFMRRGALEYSAERREPVTALAHALQCAQLAEWAHADESLVIAALLHDLGQLIDGGMHEALQDDAHELRALALLSSGGLGPAVTEPIRLHVQAKRYLVSQERGYLETLSAASVHSLSLQGGPMAGDECQRFLVQPYAAAALQLRRWDDLAKHPGKHTPPLAYYLSLIDEHLREARTPARLLIA